LLLLIHCGYGLGHDPIAAEIGGIAIKRQSAGIPDKKEAGKRNAVPAVLTLLRGRNAAATAGGKSPIIQPVG
jgi:hypothetical protein